MKTTTCRGRTLSALSLEDLYAGKAEPPPHPYALLVQVQESGPATLAAALSAIGPSCVEVCFVGAASEFVHDEADTFVEARDWTEVVTTWHEDDEEARWYFLHLASSRVSCLIAFSDAQMTSALVREFQDFSSAG